MPNRVRQQTIKIRNQTLADLKRIYAAEWREIGEDVERLVDEMWLDPEDSTQAERLKHAKNKRDKLVDLIVAAAVLANTKAIKRINSGMDKVYTINANDVVSYVAAKTDVQLYAKDAKIQSLLGKYTKRRYDRATDSKYVSRQIMKEIKRMLKEGKSIDEITERLEKVYYFNRTSAIRTTMTETTRIQSIGRNNIMIAALLHNVKLKKIWRHAVHVAAPRHWHVYMDGEMRDLDEPFSNGLMFPGDPNGEAYEVINCHCYLDEILIDW